MKKVLLMTMVLVSCILVKAQNYLLMYIDDIEPNQDFEFCLQDYDSIVIVDTVYNFSYNEHWFIYSPYGVGEPYWEIGPVLTLIPGDDYSNSAFVVTYQYYQSYGADWFRFQASWAWRLEIPKETELVDDCSCGNRPLLL